MIVSNGGLGPLGGLGGRLRVKTAHLCAWGRLKSFDLLQRRRQRALCTNMLVSKSASDKQRDVAGGARKYPEMKGPLHVESRWM